MTFREFQAELFTNLAPAVLLAVLPLAWTGCGAKAPGAAEKPPAPARVDNPKKESELATVTLTPEAEARLGIQTATAAVASVARTLNVSGEIVLPAGSTIVVAAPMAGTLDLLPGTAWPESGRQVRRGQPLLRLTPYVPPPDRDLRLQLEHQEATARERLEGARARLTRAEQLVRDKAGPAKAVEQAREEARIAETDMKSARERLDKLAAAPLNSEIAVTIEAPRDGVVRNVLAASGQAVPASAGLFEITSLDRVWVRVPVYAGDASDVIRTQSVRVGALGDSPGAPALSARPVAAPPSADPSASTVDFYYELPNPDRVFDPGEKVGVVLPLKGARNSLTVPWEAVLHDVQGGAWVYVVTDAHVYNRRPVEVAEVVNGVALLSRGPSPGATVVTAGAAELFGTEFGPGK